MLVQEVKWEIFMLGRFDIVKCSPAVFKKGETNIFLHSLNFNLYRIALKICQFSFFLLLGLDLKQESGDTLVKGYVCISMCVYVKHL